ncbi:MAG: hypothetical protein E7178_01395 [Erysipelotrichaceae bacterium]|nr:hypothetical protein [Erysipelotrichaceae bacterium]
MTFKKLLATCLSFIMVAGGLSLAFASSNNEYVPVFAEEHAHNLVTFNEWTSTDSLPANGAYYLANDVTISSTWKPANDTKLCLNGHGIRMTGSGSVIESPANGYLQILDCDKSTEHKYTFDETGLAVVDDSLTGDYETFIGGYITGGNATTGGGVLVATPGKSQTSQLYMLDVTVIGNHASGNGGGIGYNYGSKARSIISLTDCSIIGNVADGIGGGVFHQANQRFMDLSGNTVITKNISGSGCAGVYEQSGLYISHNVFLYGNTLKDGTPSDLYIGHGSGGQPDKLILDGDLESSSRIGIQYLRLETIYDYYNHCSEDPNNIFISNVNNRFFTKNGDTNNVIYNNLTKTDCSCDYDGDEHTGDLSLADDSIDYEIKYGTKEGANIH